MTRPNNGSLYLVLPVPFRQTGTELYAESQAANGLDRWTDYFPHLTVAAPLIPQRLADALPGTTWRPFSSLQHPARITAQPLPWAYTPRAFSHALRPTRALLAATIATHQHLQFAIGGLIGDWAAIAALEAIRQRRPYAIHTDRVEHELILRTAATPRQKLRAALESPLMRLYHRHLIRHCSLGLWHGDDCAKAYTPWAVSGGCRENHLIHDVHTSSADLISDTELATRIVETQTPGPLQIVYAGRLDPMKAPLAWLSTLALARNAGADLRATWYGEGALLEPAKAEAARLHLDDIVTFPGFLADRATLLRRLRTAHLLLFTHPTPESPRILLEALVSGTPILGFDPGYARNLLAEHGGGQTTPLNDTPALAQALTALANDRPRLAALTRQAAANGRRFTDTALFAHRSALQKLHA